MLRLTFLICLFRIFSTMQSGSHSVWNFATFIIGDTPFPEFNMVVMLDDFQLSYYGVHVKNMNYTYYKSESDCTIPGSATIVFGDLYSQMKALALFTKQHRNLTHGIHVQQTVSGCELLDESSGRFASWEAFNGVTNERMQFNMQEKSLHFEGLRTKLWSNIERKTSEMMHANVYYPICINSLKSCLHKKKNDVMRKVKPKVRLLQKRLPDSGGAKVTCLATGFYPRHINLTLLRDGQPVPDHHITGGELLPNGDVTYQMRKSLEVSAEELREKHHYTCTAEHLSLDNKLDIGLDFGPGVGAVAVVIPVVVLGVALLCMVGVIVMCRRRCRSTSDYAPAQKTDQHLHQTEESAQ